MNENILMQTQNLSLYYGKNQVFQNVSIPFYQNKITAIVGPSGCGKTSFLMCLNRLIDLVPTSRMQGEIHLHNTDIDDDKYANANLRKRVGMIFQRPNPFPMSIRKNILLPLNEHRSDLSKIEKEQILQKVLTDVGLWHEIKDRLNSDALRLSGGQQQRLCIARALVLDPEMLLMDEPCSALDPISSGVVEELIIKLKERVTILIVTHNLAQARRISDHLAVFWMQEEVCRLVEFGKTQDLIHDPKMEITASYLNGFKG